MARVVVTGGSGFIGSHVVEALVEAGHHVTVLDRRARAERADVTFENVDLLDMSSVLAATRGAEHIFHLAGVSNVDYAYKYPKHTASLNILGTMHVLEAARVNGAGRVYLASTVWVYNGTPNGRPLDESAPFLLNGTGHIYTSSKMACEMICHNYSQMYGVPLTVLRLGIPYGPRMREELLIPTFIRKALAGESLTIAGKGNQFRNFIYVRDLADAHVLAMKEIAANRTYNFEGPRKLTVLDVAEAIRSLLGTHIRVEYIPERPGDFKGKEVLTAKALQDLGWKAKTEFEEGLRTTVEWFRKKWGR